MDKPRLYVKSKFPAVLKPRREPKFIYNEKVMSEKNPTVEKQKADLVECREDRTRLAKNAVAHPASLLRRLEEAETKVRELESAIMETRASTEVAVENALEKYKRSIYDNRIKIDGE